MARLADTLFNKILFNGDFPTQVDFAAEYAEPGYTAGEKGILFADWNTVSQYNPHTQMRDITNTAPARAADIAEALGYAIEWSDEWVTCECGKAFRMQGDSYGWKMYGALVECECICGDCIQDDPTDYLELLKGNPQCADTIGVNMEEAGYARVDIDFERGFYAGHCDSPDAIANVLVPEGIFDFIFSADSPSQFNIKFSVWVPADCLRDAEAALSAGDTTKGDPAGDLEKLLVGETS